MERFSFVENLGEGAYGSVCRAINQETREVVAIKTLKKQFSSWEECLNLREIKCLLKLKDHAKIVRLKELVFNCNTDQTLHLVFEFMDCNLLDLILQRADSRTPFSESEIKNYAFQVLQGLAYMHLNGYMHRDLKPDNLLVSQGTIKIADFGFAREEVIVGEWGAPYTKKPVGTRWYKAPELMLGCQNYSSAVDMWSMGAVLAEMYNLEPLFSGANESIEMHKICSVIGSPTEKTWLRGILLAKKLNYKFPQVDAVCMSSHIPSASKEAVSLIRWMCSWDPLKRPTALEALQHPFFRGCPEVPHHHSLRTVSKSDSCMKDLKKSSVLELMASS